MPTFEFLDVILVLGLSQGLFLAITLQLVPNRNEAANQMLSFVLLIAVLMLLGRMVFFRFTGFWVWKVASLADTTIFLFGPLFYAYFRRLTFQEEPLFKLHWVHYIPAILHLIYFFWMLTLSLEEFRVLVQGRPLQLIFFCTELIGLLSFSIYWWAALKLVRRFQVLEQEQLAFHQAVIRYLNYCLASLGIIILAWWLSFLNSYFFGFTLLGLNYNTMWLVAPIFIYTIGFFSLRQPEIFRVPYKPKLKPTKDRINQQEIKRLKKRLDYFVLEEQVYLNPNLSLKTLADKLNTSSNNVSWLLNQVYESNFYDFINEYRVKAFLAQIKADKHKEKTLLALALEVGFNSKSTFNKAFKQFTGHTPSAYIKAKNRA